MCTTWFIYIRACAIIIVSKCSGGQWDDHVISPCDHVISPYGHVMRHDQYTSRDWNIDHVTFTMWRNTASVITLFDHYDHVVRSQRSRDWTFVITWLDTITCHQCDKQQYERSTMKRHEFILWWRHHQISLWYIETIWRHHLSAL